MLPSPTDALQPDSAADSGWNPVQRIGFRLLFSYLVLYIILVTLIEIWICCPILALRPVVA
jgi:hypothetical protein